MAILTVRNLPDEVHTRLRIRAARAGRSREAGARAILAAAVAVEPQAAEDLRAWVDRLYGAARPAGVVEDLIAARRAEAKGE